MGSMSSEGDIGLTAAGYARLHGLSTDHLAEPSPLSHIEGLQSTASLCLTDDASLTHINYPINIDTEEHLTIDNGAAKLLQGANNGSLTREELNSFIIPYLDVCHSRKLRVETPLLRTDHESDCRDFATREDYHFQDGGLPVEPLDEEMDEGINWPQRLKNLPDTLLKDLQAEKAEILKENFIYLQATIRDCWSLEDEETVWNNVKAYKKNTVLEPVTPPLLPMSPPSTPYIPSSPACHLPLLSDPASLTSDDLRTVENAIFEQDTLIPPNDFMSSLPPSKLAKTTTVNLSDIFSPLDAFNFDDHILIPQHIRPEDRKVEVPLMPLEPASVLVKTESFSDVVEEMLLDRPLKNSEQGSPSLNSDDINKFFEDAFGGAADAANRAIEQEQLHETDTKLRVEVPIMDFSQPAPPWEVCEQSHGCSRWKPPQIAAGINIQRESVGIPPWSGINKLVQKLRWSVFPSELAKVGMDESFGDENIVQAVLDQTQYQAVINSSGLVWKPPGLRILKDENGDDDDDLEPGYFDANEYHDIESLVRKRKVMYDEYCPGTVTKASSKAPILKLASNLTMSESMIDENLVIQGHNVAGCTSNDPQNDEPAAFKDLERAWKERPGLLLDNVFSPAAALDNFLEIRASKKQKSTNSAYSTDKSAVKLPPVAATVGQAFSKEVDRDQHKMVARNPLPVPSTDAPSTTTPYIISSQVLRHRLLTRTLHGLFPSAIPIERDFTAHNTTAWLPNSITRSPIASSLASEADIIVSPSTGIILTSLQKIKQKPLPGQKAQSALKERIEKVSERYERLVLLVSEASTDESTNGLNSLDTAALAELTGFCNSLCTRTTVQFVGGGEETLGKWLAAVMTKYSAQGEASVPLMEEETLWELFLRRAGLNAYAAQAIIGALKAPEGVDTGGSKAGLFGISAFVEMELEERVRRFESLLGGDGVLRRMGRMLDARWM